MTDNQSPTKSSSLLATNRERWITHKGKKIIVHDYSRLQGDDIVQVCQELSRRINERGVYDLLFLCDVTDAYANKAALAAFKEWTPRNKPFLKKAAIIGVEGITKVFLQAVQRVSGLGVRPFDNLDAALDWLAE